MPVDSVYREGKKNFSIFCTVVKIVLSLHRIKGVLAHLARARHWQCRGERFESAILHIVICFFWGTTVYSPVKRGFFFYGVSKEIIQSNRGNHIVSVECGLQLFMLSLYCSSSCSLSICLSCSRAYLTKSHGQSALSRVWFSVYIPTPLPGNNSLRGEGLRKVS